MRACDKRNVCQVMCQMMSSSPPSSSLVRDQNAKSRRDRERREKVAKGEKWKQEIEVRVRQSADGVRETGKEKRN